MILPDSSKDVQPLSTRIAAVIPASGSSRRFGVANKLLAPIDGEALVRRVARAYVEAHLSPVVLIAGHDAGSVIEATRGLGLQVVENRNFGSGMSTSIVCGIQVLPAEIEAAVIGVSDQPRLTSEVVSAIVDRFLRTAAPVVSARYGGQPAPPVLFHRSLFPQLLSLKGDVGARAVVEAVGELAEWVDFPQADLGADIDTPHDLADFSQRSER